MSICCQAGQAAAPPALLILDEVDAALDETNQRLVASLLKVRIQDRGSSTAFEDGIVSLLPSASCTRTENAPYVAAQSFGCLTWAVSRRRRWRGCAPTSARSSASRIMPSSRTCATRLSR